MVLLTLMAAITIGIVRIRNLFGVVVLSGIYSFLMASVMIVLDAVDVAMTEAAIGAGISTVLMLGALYLTKTNESDPVYSQMPALLIAIVTAGILVFGTIDLPPFGDAANPIHHHVANYYLENSVSQTTIPNVVTSVLASYRGYDTLGETAVVFTAGIGVLLLLRGRRKSKKPQDQEQRNEA
ncbi:MAG TPA: DUF4040 domain-containing protein [Rhizobiales bacterium]|nr:DUF4040 domain-containing protein [Hyphomicrobiales bacterium]